MSSGGLRLRVKRVCPRKGYREAHLTPARKRAAAARPRTCITARGRGGSMAGEAAAEVPSTSAQFCSDSEDLFGDYDSILENSGVLAELDHAEQNHLTRGRPGDHVLGDPILGDHIQGEFVLDHLEDLEDLPPSQLQFQEEAQRSRRPDGTRTSTPARQQERQAPGVRGRRGSVAEQLKRTMLENAAAPCGVSRTAALKEAVVSEEISVAMQAMESVSTETTDLGPFFGLPSRVKELLHQLRGIDRLYEWQRTCLALDCVLHRRNLIYSLPTSGGKTLVAEILLLRELLCRRKDCLLILPYISLVQEKVRGLASFGLELDFLVEEYAGSKGRFPPVRRRSRRCLYVATIEKGHSLVNALLEGGRLQEELGLLVVDELHMLGEGSRGALLEMTLAKVQYVSRSTQIVGMSATLGNIQDLQAFLQATNYTSTFRPVQLKEFVKLGASLYEVAPQEDDGFRFSRLLNFKYSSSMQKLDPDHIIALVTEVIPAHSCLVFCPTKRNCENVALMVCRHLKEEFLHHRREEKEVLLRQLKEGGGGTVCPVLRRSVPFGLAYHHSGLTSEERKLLEEAYSCGTLCLLTCTSTLAAGVNLPARRVILRSPYVGADFLKRSQYKQMVGRAGRAGIDSEGESILILQDQDRHKVKALLRAPMENCYSSMLQDGGAGLQSLSLSMVGLKVCESVLQLQTFLQGTLLHVQQQQLCVEGSLAQAAQRSVALLREKQLVTEGEDGTLRVTKLGRATFKGSVELAYSQVLYRDLATGLQALTLHSLLHLLYLVTPYHLLHDCRPDWGIYLRQFTALSPAEQTMATAVGVPESLVARKAAGQSVKNGGAVAPVVHRLYLALVLLALLRDSNLWSVSERFQLSRGFVQTLLSSSAAFCSCVLHFTQELEEFWPFRALLTELTRRLSYCVRAELIPLMEVAGVLEFRAQQLYGAGYTSLTHLANADPALLCRSVDHLHRKQANQIVASAKMLLQEKASALQEEVNELLSPPSDLPTHSVIDLSCLI